MNHPPARAFVHAAPLEVAEIAKAEPGVNAEVVQLERQLSKLVRAAENFAQHRDHDGMRQSLFDAISTAKAHLS